MQPVYPVNTSANTYYEPNTGVTANVGNARINRVATQILTNTTAQAPEQEVSAARVIFWQFNFALGTIAVPLSAVCTLRSLYEGDVSNALWFGGQTLMHSYLLNHFNQKLKIF
jgi:hypothetical protein